MHVQSACRPQKARQLLRDARGARSRAGRPRAAGRAAARRRPRRGRRRSQGQGQGSLAPAARPARPAARARARAAAPPRACDIRPPPAPPRRSPAAGTAARRARAAAGGPLPRAARPRARTGGRRAAARGAPTPPPPPPLRPPPPPPALPSPWASARPAGMQPVTGAGPDRTRRRRGRISAASSDRSEKELPGRTGHARQPLSTAWRRGEPRSTASP